jgi:micrococcal nuclease
LGLPVLLHRPRQFVILGLVLIFCLQACSSVDYGSADNPKTGYIYGTVVGITDGDTLTILTAINKTAKIRLAEIDTPERSQPYGKRAKQVLSHLTFKKPVVIRLVDIDRYERIVGRIYVDNLDVSAELVCRGAAWVYRKYAKDQNLYRLEDEARSEKCGLWGLPEAQRVPPWEWRRKR